METLVARLRGLGCWLLGHQWRVLEVNMHRAQRVADDRARLSPYGLSGYDPLDGAYARCDRCAAVSDDRGSEIERERARRARLTVYPDGVIVRSRGGR